MHDFSDFWFVQQPRMSGRETRIALPHRRSCRMDAGGPRPAANPGAPHTGACPLHIHDSVPGPPGDYQDAPARAYRGRKVYMVTARAGDCRELFAGDCRHIPHVHRPTPRTLPGSRAGNRTFHVADPVERKRY